MIRIFLSPFHFFGCTHETHMLEMVEERRDRKPLSKRRPLLLASLLHSFNSPLHNGARLAYSINHCLATAPRFFSVVFILFPGQLLVSCSYSMFSGSSIIWEDSELLYSLLVNTWRDFAMMWPFPFNAGWSRKHAAFNVVLSSSTLSFTHSVPTFHILLSLVY